MAEGRQYVRCKFRIRDTRTYTYHNEGERLAEGDQVRIADREGEGWQRVYVVSIDHDKPSFDTKPILGRHYDDELTDLEPSLAI